MWYYTFIPLYPDVFCCYLPFLPFCYTLFRYCDYLVYLLCILYQVFYIYTSLPTLPPLLPGCLGCSEPCIPWILFLSIGGTCYYLLPHTTTHWEVRSMEVADVLECSVPQSQVHSMMPQCPAPLQIATDYVIYSLPDCYMWVGVIIRYSLPWDEFSCDAGYCYALDSAVGLGAFFLHIALLVAHMIHSLLYTTFLVGCLDSFDGAGAFHGTVHMLALSAHFHVVLPSIWLAVRAVIRWPLQLPPACRAVTQCQLARAYSTRLYFCHTVRAPPTWLPLAAFLFATPHSWTLPLRSGLHSRGLHMVPGFLAPDTCRYLYACGSSDVCYGLPGLSHHTVRSFQDVRAACLPLVTATTQLHLTSLYHNSRLPLPHTWLDLPLVTATPRTFVGHMRGSTHVRTWFVTFCTHAAPHTFLLPYTHIWICTYLLIVVDFVLPYYIQFFPDTIYYTLPTHAHTCACTLPNLPHPSCVALCSPYFCLLWTLDCGFWICTACLCSFHLACSSAFDWITKLFIPCIYCLFATFTHSSHYTFTHFYILLWHFILHTHISSRTFIYLVLGLPYISLLGPLCHCLLFAATVCCPPHCLPLPIPTYGHTVLIYHTFFCLTFITPCGHIHLFCIVCCAFIVLYHHTSVWVMPLVCDLPSSLDSFLSVPSCIPSCLLYLPFWIYCCTLHLELLCVYHAPYLPTFLDFPHLPSHTCLVWVLCLGVPFHYLPTLHCI